MQRVQGKHNCINEKKIEGREKYMGERIYEMTKRTERTEKGFGEGVKPINGKTVERRE